MREENSTVSWDYLEKMIVWMPHLAEQDLGSNWLDLFQISQEGRFLESKQLKDVVLEALVNARTNADSMTKELLTDRQKIEVLNNLVGELLHARINAS